MGDGRGVAGAGDDDEASPGIFVAMYSEPARNGSSCAPTITRVGASIVASASITWPSSWRSVLRAVWIRPVALWCTELRSSSLPGRPASPRASRSAAYCSVIAFHRVATSVAAEAGTGVDEDESGDLGAMGERVLQRQVAAEGMAEQHGAVGAGFVEQRRHVGERRGDRIRRRVVEGITAPVAAHVPDDGRVVGRERRDGRGEHVR